MKLNIKKIARDKVGDYTISTVCKDEVYETAICKNKGEYIVVQQYADETRAKITHKYWVSFCLSNPLYVTDVTTNKPTLF